jgi:hypothetical protein
MTKYYKESKLVCEFNKIHNSMKVTFDFSNKTITIHDKVNVKDLIEFLKITIGEDNLSNFVIEADSFILTYPPVVIIKEKYTEWLPQYIPGSAIHIDPEFPNYPIISYLGVTAGENATGITNLSKAVEYPMYISYQ